MKILPRAAPVELSFLIENFPGVDPEKIRVSYNGLDLNLFRYHAGPRRPGSIIAVGRLIEKKGFATVERAWFGEGTLKFTIHEAGKAPPDMVYVEQDDSFGIDIPGFDVLPPVAMKDYWIDKYEVTNKQFKAFLDRGGYQKREYWKEPLVDNRRTIPWEEAMLKFRDPTGRPGPSTWELGTYPDGQDDVPVHGVSWYEADAYARFTGQMLPTAHHWRRAAALGVFSEILEFSNFGGKGPAPVGSFHGIGEYGTYDMAQRQGMVLERIE